MNKTEVAVVGAGPYGLSIAATLATKRINHVVFGTPMQFWAETMPPNMALKTSWATAGFTDPSAPYSLIDHAVEAGLPHDESTPIRLETFVAYGREFQRRSVPTLNRTHVTEIRKLNKSFLLSTEDGGMTEARRVVVATGIGEHRFIPEQLRSLPAQFLSHSATCGPFERFEGKDVIVIGGGASAIDTAAALRQFGAHPTVVARRKQVRYQSPGNVKRSLIDRIRAPDTKLGPGWRALAVTTMPSLFHAMPVRFRIMVVRRFLGPAASWPARQFVEGHVPFVLGAHMIGAEISSDKVVVDLSVDGAKYQLSADHVIAATGYRVEMARYTLLATKLREQLALEDGSPALSRKFESSVPGLFFAGTVAANAFGPMFRFVSGSAYAADKIAGHIASELNAAKGSERLPVRKMATGPAAKSA